MIIKKINNESDEEKRIAYKLVTSHATLKYLRSDAFDRYWKNKSVFLAKDEKNTILGVLTFKKYKVTNSRAYGGVGDILIEEVAILENEIGKGIGTKLVSALIKYSKTINIKTLISIMRITNIGSLNLYKKLKFKKERDVMWQEQGNDLPGEVHKLHLFYNNKFW